MNNFIISLLPQGSTIPYELLLLADPSYQAIEIYLPYSDVFVVELAHKVIGVYVLYPLNKQESEIKNIAVLEKYQGKGIGKLLLQHAIAEARKRAYKKLWIGTSNASIGQLYLYQQQGFEITELKKNFFIDNYPEPIFENGLQCKHILMLCQPIE
ncbi:GNAT family N-acetyltransferase [Emticicia sp. 17c]|uniref:GNAT family N-acetyltransferase n=1 Tax=Emticicia sp. 17c TaxID=3127704 RepID=UPI00301DC02F